MLGRDRMRTLDVKFTPQARAKILQFLAGIRDYEATLTLMKGGLEIIGPNGERVSDSEHRWTFAAYGPENLEGLRPMYNEVGQPLLYEVDGLVAAIPQYHLVAELEGKTIGLGERGLTVIDREPD